MSRVYDVGMKMYRGRCFDERFRYAADATVLCQALHHLGAAVEKLVLKPFLIHTTQKDCRLRTAWLGRYCEQVSSEQKHWAMEAGQRYRWSGRTTSKGITETSMLSPAIAVFVRGSMLTLTTTGTYISV